MRRWLPSLVFLALAAPASADPLRLSLSLAGPADVARAGRLPVVVEARAYGQPEGTAAASARQEGQAPGAALLALDGRWFWRIEVRAENYWAEPLLLSGAALSGQRAMVLMPAGRVVGSVRSGAEERLPVELELRWETVPALGKADREGRRELSPTLARPIVIRCPLQQGRFDCAVPAGTRDLSVRVPGFLSHSFWGLAVAQGKVAELGTVELRRGASVVGWLATRQPPAIGPSCEVTLTPAQVLVDPTLSARNRVRALTTHPDARGFFRFKGVEPGGYTLRARQEGFGEARLPGISVVAGAETRLRQLLVLEPPQVLKIYLDPPVDRAGQPWRLRVFERGEGGFRLEERTPAAVPSEAGSWHLPELPAGPYWLEISDSTGARAAFRSIDLEPGSGPLFLTLPMVEIAGELRLGKKPIPAKIFFGGRSGTERVEFEADEEGHFAGTLPRPGAWRVDVVAPSLGVERRLERLEVAKPSGEGPVRVDLSLPATRVEGRVLDASGRGVRGAAVSAQRFDGSEPPPPPIASGEQGRFRWLGLAPGAYRLEAELGEETADPVEISLEGSSSPGEVRLILRPHRELVGRVMAGAEPVFAARVEAVPLVAGRSSGLGSLCGAASDAAGRFRLALPAWADGAALRLSAPGFALRWARFAVLPQGEVILPLAQDGGTLVLRSAPAQESEVPGPMVWSPEGEPQAASGFLEWARLGGAKPESSTQTIPQLAPGTYTACWFASLEEEARAVAQGDRPRNRCSTGWLPPQGELELAEPGPPVG
ncbi:MAG: carboxypeptidase-like regulatory domain-containing protein [Thermoanaerobaculia bacterium]